MSDKKTKNKRLRTRGTLADLLGLVTSDTSLKETRRRNVASAIRRFAEVLDQDLAVAPASFPFFRQAILRFHPDDAGLRRDRWSTIKSDVAFALKRYGAPTRAPLAKHLTPEWRDLRSAINDTRLLRGLSRLMHFCSGRGIPPQEVCDVVVDELLAYLRNETFHKKPETVHRDSCVLWNRAIEEVPGWPKRRLAVPSNRRMIRIPWEEFPRSLIDEVCRLDAHWAAESLLDGDPDAPVLAERTRHFHRQGIRRFAAALVHSGFPIEGVTSLADLVKPANFRQAIEFYLEWLGGPRPSLVNLVVCMVAVAEHWVKVDRAALAELQRMRRNLARSPAGRRRRAFSSRNTERLRQFDDLGKQAALLSLPYKLCKMARKRGRKVKAALAIQTALAIELELNAPVRLKNLVRLKVGEHILFTRSERKGTVHLYIPAEEVKGSRAPIELVLEGDVVKLLNLYLEVYRPLLGPDNGFLFPGQKGGPKHEVTLSGQIVNAIDRHAGLRMNVHLFRHLAAKLYLDDHPGDYVTVQRLLGHTSIDTTIAFYASFSTASAFRAYDEVITTRRRKLGLPSVEDLK